MCLHHPPIKVRLPFLYLHLPTTFPKRLTARWISFLHSIKEEIHTTYPKTRITRSHIEYPVCICQYVPLPYRLWARRPHRLNDFHDRRTNRSNYLEHFTRILNRTQCFYRPKLCCRTNRTSAQSMVYHLMDDRNLRNFLYTCLLYTSPSPRD